MCAPRSFPSGKAAQVARVTRNQISQVLGGGDTRLNRFRRITRHVASVVKTSNYHTSESRMLPISKLVHVRSFQVGTGENKPPPPRRIATTTTTAWRWWSSSSLSSTTTIITITTRQMPLRRYGDKTKS